MNAALSASDQSIIAMLETAPSIASEISQLLDEDPEQATQIVDDIYEYLGLQNDKTAPNTSRFEGIYWHAQSGKYRARSKGRYDQVVVGADARELVCAAHFLDWYRRFGNDRHAPRPAGVTLPETTVDVLPCPIGPSVESRTSNVLDLKRLRATRAARCGRPVPEDDGGVLDPADAPLAGAEQLETLLDLVSRLAFKRARRAALLAELRELDKAIEATTAQLIDTAGV